MDDDLLPASHTELLPLGSTPIYDPEETLRRNQALREFITGQIQLVDEALTRNKQLQLLAQDVVRSQHTFSKKQLRSLEAQSQPSATLPRPDVLSRLEWKEKEREALRNAVRVTLKELLLTRLGAQPLQEGEDPALRFAQFTARIQMMTDLELLASVPEINWDRVALNAELPYRDATDLRLQWCAVEDPRVTRGEWSKAEDKKLLELVRKYGGFEWKMVADELGTNRTPIMCFERYQRSLNKDLVKSKWTAEEDEQLKRCVARYGRKNWQMVASYIPGRTGQQCLHRFMKRLAPEIRKGKWTPAEDQALEKAVAALRKTPEQRISWAQVAELVGSRTDVQCRERFENINNTSVNHAAWTDEEDARLMELVERIGFKWSKVAREMPGRTDNFCLRRWKKLVGREVADSYLKRAEKKRKIPFRVSAEQRTQLSDIEEEAPAAAPPTEITRT